MSLRWYQVSAPLPLRNPLQITAGATWEAESVTAEKHIDWFGSHTPGFPQFWQKSLSGSCRGRRSPVQIAHSNYPSPGCPAGCPGEARTALLEATLSCSHHLGELRHCILGTGLSRLLLALCAQAGKATVPQRWAPLPMSEPGRTVDAKGCKHKALSLGWGCTVFAV